MGTSPKPGYVHSIGAALGMLDASELGHLVKEICRVGKSREGLLSPAAAALKSMRVCIHVVPALVP